LFGIPFFAEIFTGLVTLDFKMQQNKLYKVFLDNMSIVLRIRFPFGALSEF
jgi:hypothetical protein